MAVVTVAAAIAAGCGGAAAASGGGGGGGRGAGPRPTSAKGSGRLEVPFSYDADAVADLGALSVESGGTVYLSPSPEDVTSLLRSAIHSAVAHAGGAAADICLLVDTTGSMGTAVSAAALAIEHASHDIADSSRAAKVRLAVMEYKDEGDEYVTKVRARFTTKFDKIRSALTSLVASGGGDIPEAVVAAVRGALDELEWDPDAAKTIILIADAPSHADDPGRRGLGALAAKRGVAIDTVIVGTGTYAGGYDASAVSAMPSGDGGGDDGDGSSGSGDDAVDNLDAIAKAVGHGELFDATRDAKSYRSHVTRILADLRAGASSLSSAKSSDVAFVVDTTGSMGSACSALNEMSGPIGAFIDAGNRIAVVNYKDKGDEFVSRTEVGFTKSTDDVMAAFRRLEASGGGDLPESVYAGLWEAAGLSWRPKAGRVIILIADAEAHRWPPRDKVYKWFEDTGAGLAVIKTGSW
jgi:Mg-chelatase subunit ChlD